MIQSIFGHVSNSVALSDGGAEAVLPPSRTSTTEGFPGLSPVSITKRAQEAPGWASETVLTLIPGALPGIVLRFPADFDGLASLW